MSLRLNTIRSAQRCPLLARGVRTTAMSVLRPDYSKKYADKLECAAKAKGLSVSDLHAQTKTDQMFATLERRQKEAAQTAAREVAARQAARKATAASPTSKIDGYQPVNTGRKDSTPVQSLASVMNLEKIFSTPHTSAQISALWTAFHASRSGGTGRGFICAAFPVDLYEKMSKAGKDYATFVVPLKQSVATAATAGESAIAEEEKDGFEMFLLQWQFYGSPSLPSVAANATSADTTGLPNVIPNPPTSTVLFARMIEYQRNTDYATPAMVLTFYTELARTHGIILMRGEITPHPSGEFMLSQIEAQLLGVELQKFYLWGGKDGETEKLVQKFTSGSAEFQTEEIIDMSVKLT